MTTHRSRSLLALQLLLSSLSTIGCATMEMGLADSSSPQSDVPSAEVQPTHAPDVPSFTVELRAARKPEASIRVALDRTLHVQDALVKSGALENFRRMNIELYRKLENGTYHRLEVHYDRNARRVAPRFDYAIRPADRLVITEDTSTAVDDMLQTITGPLGVLSN